MSAFWTRLGAAARATGLAVWDFFGGENPELLAGAAVALGAATAFTHLVHLRTAAMVLLPLLVTSTVGVSVAAASRAARRAHREAQRDAERGPT